MFHRFVGRVVARLVEGGMRKLVADRFSQGCDVRDPDGLRELVVKLRQDLFGDLRWPNAERPCLSGEVALARVVREREVHLLLVADLHADERLTKAGDAEILPRLDVRVARERRQGLAWHGRVDVDGENVSGPRLAVHRPELRVGVAHRGDRALDVFVGGRSGLDFRAMGQVIAELDVGTHDHRRGVPEGLAFLELRQLRIRSIDRLDALRLDDLPIGLVHQVVRGVLPKMLLAVRTLVHSARRLARTKTRDLCALHVPFERGIGRARETVGRDFDLERDLRSGLSTKRVLDGWRHGLRGVLHGERQW